MTTLTPKGVAMVRDGIMAWEGGLRIKQVVSDEEYRAWNEEYKKTQPKSSYEKRERFPTQIQYVDTNRTQTIPQMNYWMLTLPVLVLAVVLIGGRK
jgi:hypothetical protein